MRSYANSHGVVILLIGFKVVSIDWKKHRCSLLLSLLFSIGSICKLKWIFNMIEGSCGQVWCIHGILVGEDAQPHHTC